MHTHKEKVTNRRRILLDRLAKIHAELVGSRKRREEIVGHRVWGISYPYGACDARVHQAARKAGYEMGFTVEPNRVDVATDRLTIGRFEVSAGETFLQFRLKIAGAYSAVRHIRKIKAVLLRPRRR